VQCARVRVEKPTILPICQSVGVEIERSRTT
jgi:dihydroneopterin aldolase